MAQNEQFEPIRSHLKAFVAERDWDQFHTPRSLAISISIEVAELLEHFQWDESPAATESWHRGVREESADVFMYLLLLSEKLGFDLLEAATLKLESNRRKYPVSLSKGSAEKYTKFGSGGLSDGR